MAITTKTITGKIVIPGTTTGIRAKVTATPMTTAQALTFPSDDVLSWGSVEGYTDAAGMLPAAFKIPTSSAQQAELVWKFVAEPVDKHAGLPKSWLMGEYQITGSGTIDLADLVDVDVLGINTATYVTIQNYVASAQAAATASAAGAASSAASATLAQTLVTSDLGTTDGQAFALVTDRNSLTGGALFTRILTYGAPGDGDRIEIQKTDAPLNYAADTRAAFVVQQKDPQPLAAQQLVPGVVFQFESTADGVVTPGSYYSESIWMGLLSTMKKSGDGSGHAFTFIGELEDVGGSGYNELGGYQGTLTNISSTNGTMSGVEVLLKDSPDGGATSFDTQMSAVIGRVAKYHPGRTRRTQAFFASSEGTVTPDAILAVNGIPSSTSGWERGIDFSGAAFTTGVSAVFPNNTSIHFLDDSDSSKPAIIGSSANILALRPLSAAAYIDLQTYAGASAFQINGTNGRATLSSSSGNIADFQASGVTKLSVLADGTLDFDAAVTTLAVGGSGTAAAMPAAPAGYLYFYVGGAQKRIAYFN